MIVGEPQVRDLVGLTATHPADVPDRVQGVVARAEEATEAGNVALSCQGCNNHKYNKTEGVEPVSGASVTLFHPRRDRRDDHFAWSNDASHVVGLTPNGSRDRGDALSQPRGAGEPSTRLVRRG